MRLRRKGTSDGSIPLGDLIRRMRALGVDVTPFLDDGYVFAKGISVEVHYLEDPVPFRMVKNLSHRFGVERLRLYYDRLESDFH